MYFIRTLQTLVMAAAILVAPAFAAAARADDPPLFDNLGTLTFKVTTSHLLAQRYFDQGLRLAWGFNHDEAKRAFARAAEIDPACAMCWWGVAFVLGPNINLPMDPEDEPEAVAAIDRASAASTGTTELEKALIRALTLRYGPEVDEDAYPATRAARDAAWATALEKVAREHPNQADVQSLYADALMNLSPWNYWTPEGEPQPHTLAQIAALERALAANPDHPGACHLWIHAMEASPHPEKALACADKLPGLMPGAGHLVHMPAHIYMRLGMYGRAVANNEQAVSVDASYLAHRPQEKGKESYYRQLYIPHNDHFMWFAAVQQGNETKALEAAGSLARRMPVEMVRAEPSLEFFLPTGLFTKARFFRWRDILAEPAPPRDLTFATGMWRHVRGRALAATGDLPGARNELSRLAAIRADTPDDRIVSLNSARVLLEIAEAVLTGEIARAEGRPADALAAFARGVQLEDRLTDDEPHPWYHPVRELAGATLLETGEAEKAEAAFREDLARHPENGWALAGLANALHAQNREEEAGAVEKRLEKAWAGSDVRLPGRTR